MPDPESITPLLAERLDIPTDRAETLLQSMLQELKSRAATEGVHLSDLGTFEEKDGTLTFIPGPSLRRRVNHQFEGLSPEDLSGPPSAPPEAETPPSLRESSPEETETAPSDAETVPADEPSASSGADEEPSAPTEPTEEDEDKGSTEPPPEGTPDEPGGTPPEPDESTERSIPTLDPIEDESEGDDADLPPDGTDEPEEAEAHPPEEDEEEEEPASPMGSYSLIGSLLLLILLIGIGWFVFSETNLWSSSPSSYETSETETTQSEATETPDSKTPEDVSDDDQPDRYAGVRPGDEPDSAADTGTGPWTIVVASLSSRPDAEVMASDYEDQFDTVRVVRSTVDNRTRYRVTVGQYDSEAAAQRALDANASMVPSDAWTHELP